MDNEIKQRRKAKLESIINIINRAEDMGIMLQTAKPRLTLMMDLDYALDDDQIKRLEGFNDESLAHDVVGIQRYMNRSELSIKSMEDDCFIPRCW